MYNPAHFVEQRPDVLAALIAAHPLATLITAGNAGIAASHIPLLYIAGQRVLRGHMARANPQWAEAGAPCQALAIFHGPRHYISPSWYASKQEHGKVVPTWNYVVVHARGTLTIHDDPGWLLENVTALTDAQEKDNAGRWRVSDAPAEFIDGMLRSIVGVELAVEQLEGKWKVSQNRPATDRQSTAEALEELGTAEAAAMAALVRAD